MNFHESSCATCQIQGQSTNLRKKLVVHPPNNYGQEREKKGFHTMPSEIKSIRDTVSHTLLYHMSSELRCIDQASPFYLT